MKDFTWSQIFVLSFVIAIVKVILSMVLSEMGPVGKESPASLVKGGSMAFWHLLHTQSKAMNASIFYDVIVLVLCLSIFKQLTSPKSNVNSLLRSM